MDYNNNYNNIINNKSSVFVEDGEKEQVENKLLFCL